MRNAETAVDVVAREAAVVEELEHLLDREDGGAVSDAGADPEAELAGESIHLAETLTRGIGLDLPGGIGGILLQKARDLLGGVRRGRGIDVELVAVEMIVLGDISRDGGSISRTRS